ncbi:MAG: amidophosphoribosyltransferase [Gammaproteobacteria bacterium]
MCGILGIVAHEPVNQALYDGLTVLQHRGQDAAGICTSDRGRLFMQKDNGMVRDVFRTRHMRDLHGNMGIAHVRYPTAGLSSSAEAQPFYVNSPYGIALGHNGNLTNADELKAELYKEGLRHINTESDSEILLNILARELEEGNKLRIGPEDLFRAVAGVHRRCLGAYATVAMIPGFGILAFRDPFGIRPLIYGARETEKGVEYCVASESVAVESLGFTVVRDVEPGEAIFISAEGEFSSQQCALHPIHAPCLFEFVYFARPDSIIDDVSVYKARLRMGEYLARKIKREWPDHDIDVVIPIPDTSRTSALQLANELGAHYREGFMKNRYIGRTFIMPGQTIRKKSVRQKLNPVSLEFKDKNVLLVDDSIVRGTTSGQIIEMAREAGARNVYFASAAPAVRYPNVYGIDMPAATELIAHGRTDQEVAEEIGADRLFFQDLEDLIECVQRGNRKISSFDASVFNGQYVTGSVSNQYLRQLELVRSDEQKAERDKAVSNELMSLHRA